MTPDALLASVITRFPVMYLTPTNQSGVLKQALGGFQRIVGPVKKLKVADDPGTVDTIEATVAKPDDFAAVAVCLDVEGRWHNVEADDTTLTVETTSKSVWPFTITYFVDLYGSTPASYVLPPDIVPLLADYLEVLLKIPNNARAREVMATTGIQMDIPDNETLANRRMAIEAAMEEETAIIPMATVY